MISGFKTKRIKQKSLGEKIKLSRNRQNIDLATAEEATKVRSRYLESFENDTYDCLPDEVYAIGFLKRYLEFLNLPEDRFINEFKHNLATWRTLQKKHRLTPEQSATDTHFVITPKIILSSLASLMVVVIISYIWVQVRILTAPPSLEIASPSQSTKVAIEQIEIAGRTDPGAVLAINSQVIAQDRDGNFKETVALENGVNTITISSTNRFNKQNVHVLTVVKTNTPQT